MLFDDQANSQQESVEPTPLALRMRPRQPEELCGQEAIWALGKPLRSLVDQDRFVSLILWGPPGTGKTSLARVISESTQRPVVWLSAVRDGVKQIRTAIADSLSERRQGGRAHLLFMDEVHRLNRNQQDALLQAIENADIRFIGATTENPSFEVNAAVLSRSLVFRFRPLSCESLVEILEHAVHQLGDDPMSQPILPEGLLSAIADAAHGDARRALNILEAALSMCHDGSCSEQALDALTEGFGLRFDKDREQHYDTISAFIKSIRAGHADAALHYLARMLEAGEDVVFIARRLVVAASEDIGNANPTALLVASAAMDAVHRIGMPESRIILAQATTYLACSPKSNRAYLAITEAISDLKKYGDLEIPLHLRNATNATSRQEQYGAGYVYAHDDPQTAACMSSLPEGMDRVCYYRPLNCGEEGQFYQNRNNN